ncbi:MAG: OmpA family protein [Flavobacteriaceae bacterium]|nr:OmpA family protein [Flavobacteriaceae bacterium]
MNKFLQAFTVFIIWSVIALLFHFYFSNSILGECSNPHTQNTENDFNTNYIQENKSELFLISDENGKKIFEFEGNFKISSKSDSVLIPDSFQPIKDSIKNYLDKYNSTNLFIVVNYLKSEINTTSGENLGQKRGQFLKNWLSNSGIPSDRITIESQLTEFDFNENHLFEGAISLYFKDLVSLRASNATEIVTNKTLRFSFGNQSFRPTDELIDYVLELKSFLSQYPNKKVHVVGHTDSEGDATFNYNIGLKRAQFVKDFLISQQIETYKIITESRGETEPIADNTTREGKSLNRRIEIIIK